MYEKSVEIVYNRLINAADVIIVMFIMVVGLCIVIKVLWNKIQKKEKEAVSERKAFRKEIKELNVFHADNLEKQNLANSLELKEVNAYAREQEKAHSASFMKLADIIEGSND